MCETPLKEKLITHFQDLAPYHVGSARIFIKPTNTRKDIENFVNDHVPKFEWAGELRIDVIRKWGTQGNLVWDPE